MSGSIRNDELAERQKRIFVWFGKTHLAIHEVEICRRRLVFEDPEVVEDPIVINAQRANAAELLLFRGRGEPERVELRLALAMTGMTDDLPQTTRERAR